MFVHFLFIWSSCFIHFPSFFAFPRWDLVTKTLHLHLGPAPLSNFRTRSGPHLPECLPSRFCGKKGEIKADFLDSLWNKLWCFRHVKDVEILHQICVAAPFSPWHVAAFVYLSRQWGLTFLPVSDHSTSSSEDVFCPRDFVFSHRLSDSFWQCCSFFHSDLQCY